MRNNVFLVITHTVSRHKEDVVEEVAGVTFGAGALVAHREQLFAAIYEENVTWVYWLVRRLGVPPSDAEDLTQKTFVVAYERLDQLEAIDNPGGWLRGVAHRTVSHYRRFIGVRKAKAWFVTTLSREVAAHHVKSPEHDVECSERHSQVIEVLDRLSDKLRDVLVLVELEERSITEVASILGVPANTVRSRKRLARKKFAEIWEELYGRDEDG